MTLVSPVFVWKFGATSLLEKYSLAELIGLRTTGDPSEHYCRSVNSNNLHSRVTSSLYSTSVVDNDSVPRPYCHAFAGCEFNIRSFNNNKIYKLLFQERFRVFCVPMFWRQSLQVEIHHKLQPTCYATYKQYYYNFFRIGFGGEIML